MDTSSLSLLRRRIAKAPTCPGVYRWKNAQGDVLYVGKAINLRERMKSYVTPHPEKSLGPWKMALRKHIADIEWTVTTSELEALILETNLIKKWKPRYNVLMKDGKNHVYLAVTMQDRCPSIDVVRTMDQPNVRYFGPFLSAFEVRRSLDMLQMLLQFHACKRGIERWNATHSPKGKGSSGPFDHPQGKQGAVPLPPWGRAREGGKMEAQSSKLKAHSCDKSCLEFQIGKCNGLCCGAITPEEYRARIDIVIDFFKGNRSGIAAKAKTLMQEAAAAKKYERAGKIRDALTFIEHQREGQVVSDPHGTDLDVIGVGLSAARALVVVLTVRSGKLIGEEVHPLLGQPESIAEALAGFLPPYLETRTDLPRVIVIPEDLPDRGVLEDWCQKELHTGIRLVVPERGKKSHLLDLAMTNAVEKLKAQETAWETAARNCENALKELQTLLSLPSLPKRMEGFDISHLGGTETVGSMVVMIQGKPSSKEYRSFTLRTVKEGEIDDYKSLREVLRRRLRYIAESRTYLQECCKKENIAIRKTRKADQKAIERLREQEDCVTDADAYKDTVIAVKGSDIIAMARLQKRAKDILELRSIWVDREHRGNRLGHLLIRTLLQRLKREKVYIAVSPTLEEYYAELGFRHIMHVPDILIEPMKEYEIPNFLVMMISVQEQKEDASLVAIPDLLVIDGGKGQLNAVVEAMEDVGISLPVIGLAKREEDVFVVGKKDPVPFPKESPAKYLLMRLRDEAHRFSNAHREKRLKHRSIASVLDTIPGIGPKTKTELLKRFGSVDGIRSAKDDVLSTFLTTSQLLALRSALPMLSPDDASAGTSPQYPQ